MQLPNIRWKETERNTDQEVFVINLVDLQAYVCGYIFLQIHCFLPPPQPP